MVPPSPTPTPSRQILICNHKTCHQQGAEGVLQRFKAELPEEVGLEVRQCLGQCGNGPMVLILPEEIWYSHVQPQDVPKIVEQHLRQGEPVQEKLYREFHPDLVKKQGGVWVWAIVGLSLLTMVGLMALGIFWTWHAQSISPP
jgi:(2Fe-2S) ferredoxin